MNVRTDGQNKTHAALFSQISMVDICAKQYTDCHFWLISWANLDAKMYDQTTVSLEIIT